MRTNQIQPLIAAALLLLTTAAWSQSMTDTDIKPEGWKTWCIGRFLIDLPKTAEMNGQAYEFLFGKIETESFLKGEEAFGQKMKEREEELKAGKHEDKFKLIDIRGAGSQDTRIFRLTKKLIKGESRGFEAYRLANSAVLFSMKETAFAEDKIDSVLQRLETRLLPNLRHRRAAGGGHAEEIPTEPGFCIEKGFIADDGKTAQYEKAELNFRFKQWPDVRVRVYSRTNGDKLDESLLVRKQKPFPAELAEAAKQIKVLRKGAHNVLSLLGEEILETYPTDGGFFIHHFVWDAQGKPRTTTEPAFYLELDTGFIIGSPRPDVRPSLTDKQAIELFDAIVNSIRLRPTTPGKTSAADPDPTDDSGSAKRFPLGTKVSSLRSCPESGIYECPPDAPGVKDRRVFIAQGRPMPGTGIMAPKRGVAGFFGGQELKEVETMWTLVAYQEKKA